MNVEQRLIAALRTADTTEPSPDLFSRVVHSIEEDRVHRRRVVSATLTTCATVVVLVLAGFLALADGPQGRQIRLPVIELIETVALVALIVVLGPAIARFGRGYAHDLWPAAAQMATALLRLLDVAYVLVFAGYILVSAELDFGTSGILVAEQVRGAGNRIGGLVLIMGLLHAATIMALPVVALVSNSTRVGRKLPRWLVAILVLAGLAIGAQSVMALAGFFAGGS